MPYFQALCKQALGARGLAFALDLSSATLEPFGEVRCRVRCSNDMVGDYLDHLHCAVGALPHTTFVLRAGVTGSPVHVQAEANLVPGLRAGASPHTQLCFGAVPKGVAVTKAFSVFNTSSFRVGLDFRVRTYQTDPAHRAASVQLVPHAGGVLVRIRCGSLLRERQDTPAVPAVQQVRD